MLEQYVAGQVRKMIERGESFASVHAELKTLFQMVLSWMAEIEAEEQKGSSASGN